MYKGTDDDVDTFGVRATFVAQCFPAEYEKKVSAEADRRLHDNDKAKVPKGIKIQHAELQDYLLGPNSSQVVRHAKQSVLVVRD